MFKNIIGTIITRVFIAVFTLLIVVINARQLGAGNLGTISLIMLAVTIIQLFNNFVGGGALVFLTPRVGVYRLIIPAFVWTCLVTILVAALLLFLGSFSHKLEIIPAGFFPEVVLLAFIISMSSMNFMLLIGLEKVKAYNMIGLIQIITLFLSLMGFVFLFHNKTVTSYIWAVFISYALVFMISLGRILPYVKRVPLTGMKQLLKDILRFGTYVQFANIFQQLNYRLSYYIVDFFTGRMALGILSVGVQVSEGLWLIPRSIGMVQYSRISNEKDPQYAKRLTLTLAKITWIVTFVAMIILLLIPGFLFQWVFGKAFDQIRPVIASMGVGILTLSISMIFSQFFSGTNKPYHNTISSAIGLVFTLGFGLLLIPVWGIIGAGITASISYTSATLYQFIVFCRISRLKAKDFIIRKSEIRLFIREMKNFTRP